MPDMKEEKILGEIERTASSTLSEHVRTAISRLVKEMASSWSIYKMEFRTLAEKPVFIVREDMRSNVDFVLAVRPYNGRREWKNDHAEYDVVCSNDIKDRANVLESFIKAGAHEHLYRSALQFDLWYEALVSDELKSEVVLVKILCGP